MKYVISYTLALLLNLNCINAAFAQGSSTGTKRKSSKQVAKSLKESMRKQAIQRANEMSIANRKNLTPQDKKEPPKFDPNLTPSLDEKRFPDRDGKDDGPSNVAATQKEPAKVFKRDDVAPTKDVKVQSGEAEEGFSFPGVDEE